MATRTKESSLKALARQSKRAAVATVDLIAAPVAAKAEIFSDLWGLPRTDPGNDRLVDEAVAWLGRAQDGSLSGDGGVARHYSLLTGWGPSYPETTGYIVNTLLEYSKRHRDTEVEQRCRKMLDWLVSIQLPSGGFQGGCIGATPVVPVTFNTGQILLGLAAGLDAFGKRYLRPLRAAADWLTESQDQDGCWRNHTSPFAAPGDKSYDTHVAWGLFEADRVDPGRGYGEAGLRNVGWCLDRIHPNGWIENCCLSDSDRPLTHTLGYALRGILEAYRFNGEQRYLDAAQRIARGLASALQADGFLPGRLTADWEPAANWACLTGSVQIAYCWLQLHRSTGDEGFLVSGRNANRYVRRSVAVSGRPERRGAVKGSFPCYGGYGRLQYLNWACKFLIDSLVLERELESRRPSPASVD
jgi:hypothetical protein